MKRLSKLVVFIYFGFLILLPFISLLNIYAGDSDKEDDTKVKANALKKAIEMLKEKSKHTIKVNEEDKRKCNEKAMLKLKRQMQFGSGYTLSRKELISKNKSEKVILKNRRIEKIGRISVKNFTRYRSLSSVGAAMSGSVSNRVVPVSLTSNRRSNENNQFSQGFSKFVDGLNKMYEEQEKVREKDLQTLKGRLKREDAIYLLTKLKKEFYMFGEFLAREKLRNKWFILYDLSELSKSQVDAKIKELTDEKWWREFYQEEVLNFIKFHSKVLAEIKEYFNNERVRAIMAEERLKQKLCNELIPLFAGTGGKENMLLAISIPEEERKKMYVAAVNLLKEHKIKCPVSTLPAYLSNEKLSEIVLAHGSSKGTEKTLTEKFIESLRKLGILSVLKKGVVKGSVKYLANLYEKENRAVLECLFDKLYNSKDCLDKGEKDKYNECIYEQFTQRYSCSQGNRETKLPEIDNLEQLLTESCISVVSGEAEMAEVDEDILKELELEFDRNTKKLMTRSSNLLELIDKDIFEKVFKTMDELANTDIDKLTVKDVEKVIKDIKIIIDIFMVKPGVTKPVVSKKVDVYKKLINFIKRRNCFDSKDILSSDIKCRCSLKIASIVRREIILLGFKEEIKEVEGNDLGNIIAGINIYPREKELLERLIQIHRVIVDTFSNLAGYGCNIFCNGSWVVSNNVCPSGMTYIEYNILGGSKCVDMSGAIQATYNNVKKEFECPQGYQKVTQCEAGCDNNGNASCLKKVDPEICIKEGTKAELGERCECKGELHIRPEQGLFSCGAGADKRVVGEDLLAFLRGFGNVLKLTQFYIDAIACIHKEDGSYYKSLEDYLIDKVSQDLNIEYLQLCSSGGKLLRIFRGFVTGGGKPTEPPPPTPKYRRKVVKIPLPCENPEESVLNWLGLEKEKLTSWSDKVEIEGEKGTVRCEGYKVKENVNNPSLSLSFNAGDVITNIAGREFSSRLLEILDKQNKEKPNYFNLLRRIDNVTSFGILESLDILKVVVDRGITTNYTGKRNDMLKNLPRGVWLFENFQDGMNFFNDQKNIVDMLNSQLGVSIDRIKDYFFRDDLDAGISGWYRNKYKIIVEFLNDMKTNPSLPEWIMSKDTKLNRIDFWEILSNSKDWDYEYLFKIKGEEKEQICKDIMKNF